MRTSANAVVRIAAAALVAVSTIGAISAAQHYFTLDAINESMRSRRTLEESFVLMVKSGLASHADERIRRYIEDESEQLKVVHHSIAQLTLQTQRRQQLDFSLWVLAFIASTVVLIQERRRTEK